MREPKIFSRKRRHGVTFYVEINGTQHNLGSDEKAANKQYHDLLAGRQEPSASMPVAELFRRFLEWTEKNRAGRTHKSYKAHVKSFETYAGASLQARAVKGHHVTGWLDTHYARNKRTGKAIGDTHKNGAVRTLSRAFNWARKQGFIERNPISDVERPSYTPREVYITPDDWKRIVATVKSERFIDLITFMKQTGCRPFEARTVEARHLQRAQKAIVFEQIESKGKKSKRVVKLPDVTFEMVSRLTLKNPAGPIFCNEDGKPWTAWAMNCACARVAKKLSVEFFPYAIRHTVATDLLAAGVDPIAVATILGHKDLTMLNRVYQHLKLVEGSHLKDALSKLIA